MLLLRNSEGKKDGMFSCAVVSLGAVLVKFLLAGVVIGKLVLGASPDAAVVGVILGATFSSYVARRNDIGRPASKDAQEAK